MKIHLVTIGKPKLDYAKHGWDNYLTRLGRSHQVRISQLSDKYAEDTARLLETTAGSYRVGLIIEGRQLDSAELADFLRQRAIEAREVSFIIGGPDGLPPTFREAVDLQWSFSRLTFPHDLAMVVLLEALYRASSINAGTPYHH